MAQTKIIQFRGDLELLRELEKGKKAHGFDHDSAYLRFLIRQANLNTTLISISQSIKSIDKRLNSKNSTLQALKEKPSKKSP